MAKMEEKIAMLEDEAACLEEDAIGARAEIDARKWRQEEQAAVDAIVRLGPGADTKFGGICWARASGDARLSFEI